MLGKRSKRVKGDLSFLPISANFDVSFLRDMLPEAFVFLNEEGHSYKEENIRRIWHRACEKAGVSRIKMYNGCRHSTATDVYIRIRDLKMVSKLLKVSEDDPRITYSDLAKKLRLVVCQLRTHHRVKHYWYIIQYCNVKGKSMRGRDYREAIASNCPAVARATKSQ